VQASEGKIGSLADQVLLYCYHYDPKAGKYSAVISRIIQLAGGLTILSIGTVLVVLLRRGSDSELRGHGTA
jgi:protein SCO1